MIGSLTPDLCLIVDDCWGITTVWQEIRNGTLDDMIMVSEVIRDRTSKKYFSDGTVSSTVLWPYQFSGWNTLDPNRRPSARLFINDPIVQLCKKAWTIANSNHTEEAQGALLYHAADMANPPNWSKMPERYPLVASSRYHKFYKDVTVK